MQEIANAARAKFGYELIHVLLQCEGLHIDVKRVRRLYCLEGLQVRMRRGGENASACTEGCQCRRGN